MFFITRRKERFLLVSLLILHIFLRFYEIETKSIFRYDQVDSAWAVQRIIVNHSFPLIGPANKLGSGLFVGPLYYYLISIFYFFTNLDPIAAGLFAGVTSIIGFFVIFFVFKKIFSLKVALVGLFINTLTYSSIYFDRIQWEINFVPIVSLLAFYFLYKILNGEEKSIVWLAIIVALGFHVHLTTAVFIPIIVLLCLPFFPKTKKTLIYILFSIPVLLLGLSPILAANLLSKNSYAANSMNYAHTTFHGFHLTRILQLKDAALIQIKFYFPYKILKSLSTFLLPAFFIVYFLNIPSKRKFVIIALISLWYLVPWIALSGYSGEITDYYFSTNLYIGLLILSYLVGKILEIRNTFLRATITIFCLYYMYLNINHFLVIKTVGLRNYRAIIMDKVKKGEIVQFKDGDPFSYVYYVYTRKK